MTATRRITMSWKVWNAAACVVLSVGTAQARTMLSAELPARPFTTALQGEAMQPSPAVYADGQTHDDLLDGLDKLGANAKEKNEVNLDKNMMALTTGRKGGRYADLSSKMDLITVRSYEFASKGMYSASDLETLRKRLDSNGWSHIVRSQSEGESNDIAIKASGDGYISDMVILSAEAKELNIVHLRGHFRMEDVNGAMGATMGLSRGAGAGAMGVLGQLGATNTSSRSGSRSTPTSPAPPAPPAPPASPR